MKTICFAEMIGVLLLICANGVHAQPAQTQLLLVGLIKPVFEKTLVNSYQKLQDPENFHEFISKADKHIVIQPQRLLPSEGKELKSALAGTERLDSSTVETWDTIATEWVPWYKYKNTYDAYGNIVLQRYYFWEKNTSQWIASSKAEMTFDANRNCIFYNSYDWDVTTNQWVAAYKFESTYDANGNETLYCSNQWNKITNKWVGVNKDERTCDANGNETSFCN
jgi:hypothetical protein